MKAIIIARVSPEEQKEAGNSLPELLESPELHEKRLLLKMAPQNLELEGKKVQYTYQKPFDTIANCASRQR